MGVPLCEMQSVLNASLRELMHVRARHPPRFTFNPAKHAALNVNTVNLGGYTHTRTSLHSLDSHFDSRKSRRQSDKVLTISESQKLWARRGEQQTESHTGDQIMFEQL